MTDHEQYKNVIPFSRPQDDVDPKPGIEANIRTRLENNFSEIFAGPESLTEMVQQNYSDRVFTPEISPKQSCTKALVRKLPEEGQYALSLFRDNSDSHGKYQDQVCWLIDMTDDEQIGISWAGDAKHPGRPESPRLRDVTRLGPSELEVDPNDHTDIKEFTDKTLLGPLTPAEEVGSARLVLLTNIMITIEEYFKDQ